MAKRRHKTPPSSKAKLAARKFETKEQMKAPKKREIVTKMLTPTIAQGCANIASRFFIRETFLEDTLPQVK
jgi:hypothetical protein